MQTFACLLYKVHTFPPQYFQTARGSFGILERGETYLFSRHSILDEAILDNLVHCSIMSLPKKHSLARI